MLVADAADGITVLFVGIGLINGCTNGSYAVVGREGAVVGRRGPEKGFETGTGERGITAARRNGGKTGGVVVVLVVARHAVS